LQLKKKYIFAIITNMPHTNMILVVVLMTK
jgi:hypothetical protein